MILRLLEILMVITGRKHQVLNWDLIPGILTSDSRTNNVKNCNRGKRKDITYMNTNMFNIFKV